MIDDSTCWRTLVCAQGALIEEGREYFLFEVGALTAFARQLILWSSFAFIAVEGLRVLVSDSLKTLLDVTLRWFMVSVFLLEVVFLITFCVLMTTGGVVLKAVP